MLVHAKFAKRIVVPVSPLVASSVTLAKDSRWVKVVLYLKGTQGESKIEMSATPEDLRDFANRILDRLKKDKKK